MLEFANNKYTANYHISSFQELEAKEAVSQDWIRVPALLLISQVTSAESLPLSGPLSPQLSGEALGLDDVWGLSSCVSGCC